VTQPSGAPLPVSATYYTFSDTWEVKFDQLLLPGSLDHTNWAITMNNFLVTILTATAWQNYVLGTASRIGGGPTTDTINYSPPPADVKNRQSDEAAAIASYPLTVV
jgi:hypothetical protein